MTSARLVVNFAARCRSALCPSASSILASRSCVRNYLFVEESSSAMLRPLHPHYQKHIITRNSSSFTKTEYIHPLSQIVLEHLQSNHGEWVKARGLDKGLELKKDGTFVLRFPQATNIDGDDTKKGSIWTMYEAEESKHYLCVRNENLVGRYMLQDNKKPAWHTDKRSTPERVQNAVDEMILKMGG